MDEKQFLMRYKKFWQHFHSGQNLPDSLRDTALHYHEILNRKNVSYEKFDKICSALEEEQEKLDNSFNLVAYVLDWIAMERREEIQNEEGNNYISLPQKRTSLGEIDLKKLELSIKILEKNCPNLGIRDLLERINTLRLIKGVKEDQYCQACNNTGWVSVWEKSGLYPHSAAAYCLCSKGQQMKEKGSGKARSATGEECKAVAKDRNGIFEIEKAPF